MFPNRLRSTLLTVEKKALTIYGHLTKRRLVNIGKYARNTVRSKQRCLSTIFTIFGASIDWPALAHTIS